MAANKKRKIDHLSDLDSPRPRPSSRKQYYSLELSASFEKFEDAMCDLLESASVVTDLRGALGDEKASFVFALQRMISIGDLTWVKEVDTDNEETADEREAAGSEVTHESHTPMFIEDRTPQIPWQLPAVSRATIGDGYVLGLPKPWPPPLPPISNPSLRLQIFTPSKAAHKDSPWAHYERLEWLGDAYLEAAVSRMLHDRFPDEREGFLTRGRQKLVMNIHLSSFAAAYGFENIIVGIRDLPDKGGMKAKSNWKLLADCFEAYVGAVAISDPRNSLETLITWLTALYEPDMERMRRELESSAITSKVRFSTKRVFRRPEFRRARSPSILRAPPRGEDTARRLDSIRARSRSLSRPRPTISNCPIQWRTNGSRPPTAIDESESDWEEIETPEKAAHNGTQIPLNDNAKIRLRSIIGGDGVALDYVRIKSESPGGDPGRKANQHGHKFHVTLLLTGWGCLNQALGSGCGATQ